MHEKKAKENHKRVGSIYVKKKFNFFGLRQINFETFFAN